MGFRVFPIFAPLTTAELLETDAELPLVLFQFVLDTQSGVFVQMYMFKFEPQGQPRSSSD